MTLSQFLAGFAGFDLQTFLSVAALSAAVFHIVTL